MNNRKLQHEKGKLRDRELNPGLPRDRRRYSPLYYRGDVCAATRSVYKLMHVRLFSIQFEQTRAAECEQQMTQIYIFGPSHVSVNRYLF